MKHNAIENKLSIGYYFSRDSALNSEVQSVSVMTLFSDVTLGCHGDSWDEIDAQLFPSHPSLVSLPLPPTSFFHSLSTSLPDSHPYLTPSHDTLPLSRVITLIHLLYLSIQLSIHPSIHLYIYLSIHPSIHLSNLCMYLYIHLSNLCMYLYIHPSIYLSIQPYTNPFISIYSLSNLSTF